MWRGFLTQRKKAFLPLFFFILGSKNFLQQLKKFYTHRHTNQPLRAIGKFKILFYWNSFMISSKEIDESTLKNTLGEYSLSNFSSFTLLYIGLFGLSIKNFLLFFFKFNDFFFNLWDTCAFFFNMHNLIFTFYK